VIEGWQLSAADPLLHAQHSSEQPGTACAHPQLPHRSQGRQPKRPTVTRGFDCSKWNSYVYAKDQWLWLLSTSTTCCI